MKTRTFGKTGFQASEIGLGCWQLGGADWGEIGDEEALATMREAVESGVNFFDTADVYGTGRSENLIGRFLNESREPVFVATKLGRFPEPGWPGNFSLNSFRMHAEASLRRLGKERIDLIQLHCLPAEVLKRGEVFDWLRILQREGKVKGFGASVESMDEALFCLEQEGLASLQIIFNIFRQKPVVAVFDKAQARGVALIIRLPLASGLLSGKYSRETQFPEGDHRSYNRQGACFNIGETFAGLEFERGVEAVEKLKGWVPEGMTLSEMALRWCLDFEAVSVVIPGARNAGQARANARASELPPLSPDLHDNLREFYEKEIRPHIRGPY